MNRGYAILLDAIVAAVFVIIIASALMGTRFQGVSTSHASFKRLHYVSEDALDVLNKRGILDSVGEFWAEADGNFSSEYFINATNTSMFYLDQIIPPNMGYRLEVEGDVIAENSRGISEDSARSKTHASRLLVGYGRGLPTRGNVARAFLNSIKLKVTNTYTYFGGYVGQGNITVYTPELPLDANVLEACLELNSGSDFNLFVNGFDAGNYSIDVSAGNMSKNVDECIAGPGPLFTGGQNTVKIAFEDGNISNNYIGGGFLRITYNTSEMDTAVAEGIDRYWFPGIDGIINLYDSFFVPGKVQEMDINLFYESKYSTYLNIRDVSVYNFSGGGGAQNVSLNDSLLSSLLIYNPEMSGTTVPIRMGTGNISSIVETGSADVVLVTDVSGSMMEKIGVLDGLDGTPRGCDSPGLFDDDTRRMSLAKCLAIDFVNEVMNYSGNRISLISFDSQAEADGGSEYRFSDPQDNESLISHIESYPDEPSGGTCICCALNLAYDILEDEGSPGREPYIIVMSDGMPSRSCGGCSYEPRQVIFETGFEDAGEESEWEIDLDRTSANPGDVNYGREDEGPDGPHDGNYYLGIWGSFSGDDAAINRTPIDITGQTDVRLTVYYSYEDTEGSDEITMYYWDGAWIPIFEDYDPDNSGQEPWTQAEVGIPDHIDMLSLQFRGETSQTSEHIMIDDLKLTIPAAGGTACGTCGGTCTQTSGDLECLGQSTDCNNAACEPGINDAICSARRAYNDLGAEVRTIGFGPAVVGCTNAENTLEGIADCGDGDYCEGGSSSDAQQCYLNYSREIYTSSIDSQSVFFGGDLAKSSLYPESYIEFRYEPYNISSYGKVSLTRFTDAFNDTDSCSGNLTVPSNVEISSLKATSYSGEHWTDYVQIENVLGVNEPYRLWLMSENYRVMGDPFIVDVPVGYAVSGADNKVMVVSGDSQFNRTNCSADNRMIYTMRLQSLVGYGDVYARSEGCLWNITFSDSSTIQEKIPSTYNGSKGCVYSPINFTLGDGAYDGEDAVADAVHRLLTDLDMEDDGMVDVVFDPSMVDFELTRAGGVQSLWGPVKFKLIIWM